MRILILANADIGLYQFRKELLAELVKENEVFVALPKGEFYQEITKIGCSYIEIPLERHGTNPFRELRLLSRYRRLLREVAPDMVFTYTVKPNVYGGMACAARKIPYIANVTGLGTAVENGGMMQLLMLSLMKRGFRRAKKVFFQNTENRDFLLSKKVVSGPYDVLPGSGVNLEGFPLLDYPSGDRVNFVFVARIMKEKGIDQYLEAARAIRAKHPNTAFHICGFCEQAYEETLRKAEENGVIVYHGMVKDMRPIYQMADCTVHPTYYPEGISNVLLESCASGRPIITTDRSGCREVVDDGVNGFVVRQKDSADLIEKIERFLALSREERAAMGIAARKKVEKEFDRRIVIQKYMEELKR